MVVEETGSSTESRLSPADLKKEDDEEGAEEAAVQHHVFEERLSPPLSDAVILVSLYLLSTSGFPPTATTKVPRLLIFSVSFLRFSTSVKRRCDSCSGQV